VAAQPGSELHVAHLVERDAELAAAVSALDSARSGAGSLLLIEGPAGIGKTALADAARGRATRDGMRVLHARATELEQAFPFGVVQQCLAPVVRRAEDRERLLQGAAALAEPVLLAVPPDGPPPPAGLLHGLFWLVSSVADEAPVAIVVDDVQWADEPSLLFLAYLARRVESLPVALIVGVRTEDDAAPGRGIAELLAIARGARLQPRPLGLEGVEQVLGEAGAGRVDREFAAACRAATGGNPFLLGELANALVSEGAPFTAGAVARVQTVAPATVAQAVTATLARLGAPPTALARAAAVIGDGAAFELTGELAGLEPEHAASAAAALVHAGLLGDARELRFRHPILGAAVAAAMPTHARDAAHRHAAELLRARGAGPERIAVQLIHTPPAGDARVVAELRRAAAHATASGAPETAAALLRRALAEPPDAPLRGEVLFQLGLAELATGRVTEGGERMQEAYRCAPDARTRGLAVSTMGSFRIDPRARDRIVSMAEEVLPELGPEDRDLALRIYAFLILNGRVDRIPEVEGATPAEASFLGHLVFAKMVPGARADEIADIARRASAQAPALVEEGGTWLAATGIVLGLLWTHNLDEAERLIDQQIASARRRGSISDFAAAMTMRAQCRRRAGRLRDAEADARTALEAELEPDWLFARGVPPLVLTLVEQGRPDEAAAELAAAVPDDEIIDAPPMTPVLLARMWVRHAGRDHLGARADWEEALRRSRERGANAGWIEDFAVAVDVHAALGNEERARALASESLEIAEAWGTPGARGIALHTCARVRDLDVDMLRSASLLLADSPLRLDEARVRVALGAALRRAGHRVDSRGPLREGYELAVTCGAEALAETARSELRASGIRVQRTEASGADALTASERRIAQLAASGLSNPEIAQELFLTVKTIEMHLTRAYRKLDIRRRSELPAAM
jgi:DNA-binding CsgD family transcriptional regulator